MKISRREFLKAASAASLSVLLGGKMLPRPAAAAALPAQGPAQAPPNILLFIFDALSAFHLSLHGYPRQTTPNLERFASRATVYHNHHSAANFTTPSTASLFTGVYPWTHRAFNLSGLITPAVQPNNLFRLLDGTYHQLVFSQNLYADTLLYQFNDHLQQHEGLDSFNLAGHTFYNHLFPNDAVLGLKSYDEFLFLREEAHGSLFLSILNDLSTQIDYHLKARRLAQEYPDGLPRLANTNIYFSPAQLMDGLIGLLQNLPSPTFAYLHLMPPHEPYMPSRQYLGKFADGWSPEEIKKHRLAPGVSQPRLNERRQTYDEYLANLDAEFGRLLEHLEKNGLLENSYVILTSDHGEMFERGAHGHSTPLLFEPVFRPPLIISAPGQRQRQDVSSLTSNLDILPSLLHIAGLPIPDWAEGRALPALGGDEGSDQSLAPQILAPRSLYALEAKTNAANRPLTKFSVALLKGDYKLVFYKGYRYYSDKYEFYDLANDPSERQNLYPDHPACKELQAELVQKLEQTNAPYQR